MGFFDNAPDLDTLPDDPFALPENTYLCRITEVTHGPTKNDPNKFGIFVKYQITEGDYASFFPFGEWLHTPGNSDDPSDPKIIRAYANLKKHFVAFGFGADELKNVGPDDLKDREVYLKLKSVTQKDKQTGKEYKQVKILDLYDVDSYLSGNDEFSESGQSNAGGADVDF